MNYVLREIKNLVTHRHYIWSSAVTNFRYRYGGMALGNFWHFAGPLALVALLSIVFSSVMPVNARGLEPGRGFVLYLCSGMMLWLSFVDAVSRSSMALLENSQYIRKLALPEIVFVSQAAISSAILAAVSVVIVAALALVFGRIPSLPWISILPCVILLMFFAAALGLLLAPLIVVVPDVGQSLPIIFQIWMWLSPIVYVIDAVPENFRTILRLNPITAYIDAFRAPILHDLWPTAGDWLIMVAMPVVTFVAAIFVLGRLRSEVRDIL